MNRLTIVALASGSVAAVVARRATLLSTLLACVAAGMVPRGALAQGAPTAEPPRLGLGASSAFGLHAGAGRFRHASLGPEVGGTLDLGWIGSRQVRLSVGLDYLSTTVDRPDSLGVRERGRAYVFAAFADLNFLTPPARHIAPYGGVGFGVDAVGTTVTNAQIGSMYNTNVFDLHGQVGVLLRLTPRGRLKVELRGATARVVPRIGVRVGYTLLYNDLLRR